MAQVETSGPDFECLRRTITEAYRNDNQLDGIELDELGRQGLSEEQIRLIRDTIFIDSPGELLPEETEPYQKAGLGELARLLAERPARAPLGVQYWGGGPSWGFGRFAFHNPLNLENPFPNGTSMIFSLDLAVGWGRSDEEVPLVVRPLEIVGELRLTLFGGHTHDKVDVTKEAKELAHNFTSAAERELEAEIKRRAGVEVDLDLSKIDFGEIVVERNAIFYGGLLQWRRLLTAFSSPNPRWNFFDIYLNLGMGLMHTSTQVRVLGESSQVSEFSLLGRVSVEMDAIRLTLPGWVFVLRGGIGLMAGQQGGADALIGLVAFRRP